MYKPETSLQCVWFLSPTKQKKKLCVDEEEIYSAMIPQVVVLLTY